MTAAKLVLRLALCVAGWTALWAPPAAAQQRSQPPADVPVAVILGIAPDGTPAPAWLAELRDAYDADELRVVLEDQHAMTEEEAGWAALIRRHAGAWSDRTDSLQLPFEAVAPPDTVYVVLGNVGGEDAFSTSDSTIGFDLHRLSEVYGSASEGVNEDRIDRFFAHEFTHVMHRAWRKTHEVTLASPLDRALWRCLVEGLGNYRSLSEAWVSAEGTLTPHAREVLSRLEPVFVERIAALAHASADEEAALVEGLSMGPFDQKWGALPVALWLAQDARGDDRRLRRWVEAGPGGVLTLARLYLPEALRDRIPRP